GVVRGERDRSQRDLRSRCSYLSVALTRVRGSRNPFDPLLSRAPIRLSKAGLADHDENRGTRNSNPFPLALNHCQTGPASFSESHRMHGVPTPRALAAAPTSHRACRGSASFEPTSARRHYGRYHRPCTFGSTLRWDRSPPSYPVSAGAGP